MSNYYIFILIYITVGHLLWIWAKGDEIIKELKVATYLSVLILWPIAIIVTLIDMIFQYFKND